MSALAILTNCPLANCSLAKRPLVKCLDTMLSSFTARVKQWPMPTSCQFRSH